MPTTAAYSFRIAFYSVEKIERCTKQHCKRRSFSNLLQQSTRSRSLLLRRVVCLAVCLSPEPLLCSSFLPSFPASLPPQSRIVRFVPGLPSVWVGLFLLAAFLRHVLQTRSSSAASPCRQSCLRWEAFPCCRCHGLLRYYCFAVASCVQGRRRCCTMSMHLHPRAVACCSPCRGRCRLRWSLSKSRVWSQSGLT
jgi:hypothetical protein